MKSKKIHSNCTTGIRGILPIAAYAVIVLSLLALQLFFARDAFSRTEEINPQKDFPKDLNLREVRVGCYENKPKIFTSESGAATGIFPTILNEIAKEENWQLTYIPCEWEECFDALQNGQIDLMPDVAFSLERHEKFDFNAEPILNSWSSVYARKSKNINNIYDLNGLKIAVLKGSIQQKVIEQMAKGFDLQISFIESRSFEEAFDLTAKGSADAAVSNHYFGDYFHEQYGLEKTYIVLNPVILHFAAAPGSNHDLLRAIDRNLLAMKAQSDSAYYKALQAWIKQTPKAVIPLYIIYLLFGLIGVSLFGLLIIWLLRRQVRAATMNLSLTNKMLTESEKKFRDLFEKHTAVKLIINPEDGNIVEANESAEKFYGYSKKELLRMRIQEISMLSPEQMKAEMEKAEHMKQSCFESRHRLADGSVRDVEVFSSVIDISGKTFLHSIIHDITDKRNVEEKYRQAQKIEAVGQLAGGVAHDYNNMLTVILGYTELALKKVGPSDPLRSDLIEVQNAAKQSARITRQLLAFARKQAMEPKVLDLNESITTMLKILRRLIGEDVDLIWRPGADVWPVYIDPSQLDQILVNLCTNAKDAIAGVGKIIIETDNATFDEAYCKNHDDFIPGDFTMVSVSDDGCGMDRETLNNIFEPFFTTKELGKGTGLGLSTVYGIVKQNKGFINVYSETGKGTVFRIYLPRHEGERIETSLDQKDETHQSNGETVLLVEDDRAILKLSRKFLETLGYRVLMADTPSQALVLAKEHAGDIDLLVTDVIMPEMNGRELYNSLCALYPNMKVLFMSGYSANVITYRDILDEGMIFLQKPFSIQDLARKVRKALGKG
ncbi:conserved hypothetical protein [anaerobic digester metagenome]|uniref:Histidine kinase n=1 Tax=anaerobic digester metagenome TaxID=1263854 RepID=A0A485M1G5_9ZZZZ